MDQLPIGSKFYKCDLHNHTPGSTDYRDKGATGKDVVDAAEKAGIGVLAITDHNCASWVDSVRDAAKGTSVTVIPGVEITTPEGHVLALFDLDFESAKITDLLVSLGVPREKHGRAEAITTEHAERVFKAIHEAEGIAIAAHCNENSGLLKNKGQYKIRVVPLRELVALELSDQDDIERHSTGKVSPDYPPKACVQSSDSHSLSEIGRRATYLEMHRKSLRGIRQALLDHELKVRFPWNYAVPSHPYLLSLKVDQGFFGGQEFAFHEGLNCLIGGKGTGKSTVIELLRYCFDDTPEFEHIKKDHEGKIETLVGEGGTIEARYVDGDGELKIVRREVQPWTTEREVTDSAGNPATVVVAPAFFSQGELVEIARSPLAQMDLIDRRLDLAAEHEMEQEAIEQLKANATALVAARRRLETLKAEIDHPETGKLATKANHDRLEKQLTVAVLKDFPSWEAEQRYLADIDGALTSLSKMHEEALDSLDLEGVGTPAPADAPNAVLLKPLARISDAIEKELQKEKADFASIVKAQGLEAQKVRAKIAPAFAAKRAEHDKALEGLGQADTRKANAQFRNLGKRLESLNKHEEECGRLTEKIKATEAEHLRLVAQMKKARTGLWKKRVLKAKEYEAKLSGVVRIDVVAQGDRADYAKSIRELSRGGRLKDPEIEQIAKTVDPDILLQHVLKDESQEIVAASGVTPEVAGRLVKWCSEKDHGELYDLAVVPLADLPVVRYVVEPGRDKELSELSTGQKGTVIIELAMIEGAGPLVVDHPEEPLDTQSIYAQVVRTIRQGKAARQFVFTTHNANIAVGADAEVSHVLDATADKGHIESTGGIDDERTNKLLLVHLEGGPEALERRSLKYGL